MTVEIVQGDCRAVLAEMQAESFSACVTDPPYHLVSQDKRPATRQCPHAHRRVPSAGFMGQAWDGGDVAFQPETWAAVYRVLKPGAFLLAFGGTRTFHRLACAIEDAGFEIRDTIMWLYGSGFPKSHDVSKAIDRTATAAASSWQGWGTALKPACEPIVVARKPLSEGTVAANVLRHGTGAINIDAGRVACDPVRTVQGQSSRQQNGEMYSGCDQRNLQQFESHANGRWPANVCHDGSPEVLDAFSRFGERPSGAGNKHANGNGPHNVFSGGPLGWGEGDGIGGDTGTAARFFKGCKFEPGEIQHALRFAFHSKADSSERVGSHPTVKPAALMEWLVQLITPPGGRVLDPFCGTGSSLVACDRLGFDALGIEQDAQTVADANEKIRRMRARRFIGDAERVPVPEGQLGLF